VLEALRAGFSTPDDIATQIYASLASGLRAAAVETVLAHLVHLEETGRATRAGDIWRTGH
jgi:hypothetical protein